MENNLNNDNTLINNNETINTNKNQYNNDNLEIEKNSFNYNNKLNNNQNSNENSSYSESAPIKALIELDMVHATNNYYNNIVEAGNPYKVFVRPDGKPDYGNYSHFNNYVKFDKEKYKRPEIFYGYVHDQYIVPHILHGKVNNDKNKENENEKNDNDNSKKNMKSNSKNKNIKNKNNQKSKVNTIKSLDDIMNKFNLKYIEPPPKEKKVVPPPPLKKKKLLLHLKKYHLRKKKIIKIKTKEKKKVLNLKLILKMIKLRIVSLQKNKM